MRLLTALSLLQSLCLVAILIAVAGEEPRPGPAASVAPGPAPVATGWFDAVVPAAAPAAAGVPDEALLRQVIREELAAARRAPIAGEADAPALDAGESERRRAEVAGLISHYRSVGRINQNELAELHRAIAGLDAAGRREMLGTLARAVNAQQLDVRF